MPLRAQGGLNHLDKTPCLGVCGLALALEVLHQFLERHLQACMSALRFRLGDATSVCRRLARLLRDFSAIGGLEPFSGRPVQDGRHVVFHGETRNQFESIEHGHTFGGSPDGPHKPRTSR